MREETEEWDQTLTVEISSFICSTWGHVVNGGKVNR